MSKRILRLILGDQLNSQHSWFNQIDPEIHYLMMEIGQELRYVTHHIQKIAAFFLAMRNFCLEKTKDGHWFIYMRLEDPENSQNLSQNIKDILKKGNYTQFQYLLPDEYRLDQELNTLIHEIETIYKIPAKGFDTEHFFTDRKYLERESKGRKVYLMETFYRKLRMDQNILISEDGPEGGLWNLDKENRKPYDFKTTIPPPKTFSHNASPIRKTLDSMGFSYIGQMKEDRLTWPVSRTEALEGLSYFVENLLPNFGQFEDAMVQNEPNLFHSRLSFSLNIKLISPHEVIQSCLLAYYKDPTKYSLASVEGFIRQILGWREFMRGQYWATMPKFSSLNFFNHSRKLPSWFWTGNTKMNCLHQSISDSLTYGYAHHIQRLMITGNFSLLSGFHPDEVDQWYLGIYIDAIEWVEITNTRGMSQWADGGIIASKPYVSSGNYISKMSNYCKSCIYDSKKRSGEKSCPFNSLYWAFFLNHKRQLEKNFRLTMVYKNIEKLNPLEIEKIQNQAQYYISHLESL